MIKWIGSPNFDTTRKPLKQVVIHWIVGNLASADTQFQKPNGTSAHYGIEDDIIHQYIKEENTAYAVGVYLRNQETISIEHSAAPDRPASDKTYETSGKLIADICKRNNIPLDRQHIIGHKEIKATQCPGTIDIERLILIAKSQSEPMAVITQKELDIIRLRRDELFNLLQAETAKNNDLSKQLQDEQTKNQNLREAFDKQTQADADTGAQLLDAQHERDDYLNRLNSLRNSLQAPSIELADLLSVIDKLKQPIDETVKNTIPVMDKMYSNLPKNKIKSIKDAIILAWNLFLSKFKRC
ncbi:MAG: peptidoglycan recognition family protein [Nanoarchaeota archaeon]